MAAYPTTPYFNTNVRPLTKVRTQIAESGVIKSTNLAEEDAYTIDVEHPGITSADVSTLQSFYQTNKYNSNTIPAADGNTYDFVFTEDYRIERISATYFTARNRLVANRQ